MSDRFSEWLKTTGGDQALELLMLNNAPPGVARIALGSAFYAGMVVANSRAIEIFGAPVVSLAPGEPGAAPAIGDNEPRNAADTVHQNQRGSASDE